MSTPLIQPSSKRNNPSLADMANYGWAQFGSSGDAVYASGTTFTMTGDRTAYMTRGRRLRIYHAGTAAYKYVTVVSSSYSAPNTTVTVSGNTLLNETYSSIWVDLSPASYAGEIPSGTALSAGDLIYGGTDTMPTRLAIGAVGGLLKTDGSVPSWFAKPTVPGILGNDADGTLAWITTGWLPMGVTLTYSSVDDPTGVVTSSVDLSAVLSVGTRIRFVNGGNTIYGIITAISGTTITFLHEIDPSDSLALTLMANSAITAPFFSYHKAPYGFPVDPLKWSVQTLDTTGATQSSPSAGVWYNLGTISRSVPIGAWRLFYITNLQAVRAASTDTDVVSVTLSTANNSQSDASMTASIRLIGASATLQLVSPASKEKHVVLASKQTFYLNTMATAAIGSIWNRGDNGTTVVRAVFAYL